MTSDWYIFLTSRSDWSTSGGESLETEERVCKYTAGSSDTNPIFLFSVASLEGSAPPVSVGELTSGGERDLQPEVETSLNLPDTHNTVSEDHRVLVVLNSK